MTQNQQNADERFEKFYATFFPKVKGFALLLTKSENDAEDIAQSIFMKLWLRPDLWNTDESMEGYLYVVTRNEIFAMFKHQQIEKAYEEKIMRANLLEELSTDSSPALEDIYYREKLMLIEMALKRMPDRRRTVFELSRFEGLSNREIAQRLDMPVRTVEDHIYRTLQELRKVLIYVILFHFFQ